VLAAFTAFVILYGDAPIGYVVYAIWKGSCGGLSIYCFAGVAMLLMPMVAGLIAAALLAIWYMAGRMANFFAWLAAFFVAAVAVFAAMALSPWPLCLWCEYEAPGVYRVTPNGIVGEQVDGWPEQYLAFARYPNVKLPLNASMLCTRGIYIRVDYPTAVVDCGRDLPRPERLLKVNVTIASGVTPTVCFDDYCVRIPRGRHVLWYDYRGRIFVGKLNAVCRAVHTRVVDVDYSEGQWIIYPNELKITNTSYVCTHGCTVVYNVSGVLLKFTTAPSMYAFASSASFTAEECALS